MKSVKEIHDYWENPNDGSNKPRFYFKGEEKSGLILKTINGLRLMQPRIMELGCNVGRNLATLNKWHYTNLYGIELNPDAVKMCYNQFPELSGCITLGTLEDVLPVIKDNAYDVVFTMAVLEHIHPDSSEAIFDEMVRITKRYIITIEDEHHVTWRHFPRRYDEVFIPRGMRQIKQQPCGDVKRLNDNFVLRVFKKVQ